MSTASTSPSAPPRTDKELDLFSKTFWHYTEPYYGGKSTVPNYQMSLYYTPNGPEGNVHR